MTGILIKVQWLCSCEWIVVENFELCLRTYVYSIERTVIIDRAIRDAPQAKGDATLCLCRSALTSNYVFIRNRGSLNRAFACTSKETSSLKWWWWFCSQLILLGRTTLTSFTHTTTRKKIPRETPIFLFTLTSAAVIRFGLARVVKYYHYEKRKHFVETRWHDRWDTGVWLYPDPGIFFCNKMILLDGNMIPLAKKVQDCWVFCVY